MAAPPLPSLSSPQGWSKIQVDDFWALLVSEPVTARAVMRITETL